jgi:L-cystine uptake protein TcyP (sodium:dicarboxylate symporter family)
MKKEHKAWLILIMYYVIGLGITFLMAEADSANYSNPLTFLVIFGFAIPFMFAVDIFLMIFTNKSPLEYAFKVLEVKT